MESAEGVRSHSWWWNSHISPKNSKWLQESMADMDSKITAMLKIIEEDADSFAQRAEMYYKKRPELINLVEDFYRAYRALAERYDSITEELRQNIRLQYALSSSDSSRKIDASIQRKKELHEFDSLMVSLSESFSGFGYDEDEDSEVSSRALKQPFDDAGPFSTCMEAEGEGDNSKLLPELVQENNARESNNKISILQQKNQQLVEENKLLKVMTSTHAGKTNNYDVHLPELQKKIKNLEDEGKQIRDRLQAAIERANILETENLKLNSLQLALEEEKAEMAVSYERSREDYQLTSKQVKDLEESLCHLRHKTSKEASAGAEKIRQLEEEAQKLQCSLLNLRQGKKEKEMELQGCIQQLLVVENKLLDLQVTFSKLQVESSGLKCELASKTVYIEKLQKQVLEWQYLRMSLDGEESAKAAAEEKLKDKLKIAIEQVEKLEAEIQHLEQRLHSVQMMERKAKGLEEEILQLQEENNALEITRLDRTLLITKLENELQECEWQREILQNEVSSCKEQFRELQSELSVCKEQKQMLSSQLSASAVQFNKAQEGILKLHKCKSLLEEEVSMQLIIVSMQEEETFKLQEENVKLASRLQDKTKQLQEYEENRLEQQLFLRSQQDRNVELLSEKSSRTTQDHNDLLEDLKQLNVNLSKLEEENQYIKTESSVRMTLLDNIVSEVAQLNEEKHTLNFELELKVQQAAMLQNHLNKQTIETEEVKEELQAGLGKIKLLEEKILMLEQEMKKLQGENRRLAESSYRVEECYKDCEKKLDQANVEINFLRNVNVQKHVELASRVETTEKLEEEINKLLREQKILHDERLSNIRIINESKEEVRKLQEDRKQLNLVIQQKVAELQHRDTLVQLLHIRSFQTKEENESLRDLISRTSNEWTFSGNNVRQVVEELTNLKSQRMHLDDKLLERIAHEKQLAEEVCRLQIEKNILLEENASNARNLRVSKQEVCNLQEVEKVLKDSLKASEKEIKMLQLAIEKLELSLSSSKQKTDELRKWIKRDVEEYTSIRNSVTEMQEDLSELEKEKSNLQFDTASAEACIFELEEMVSTLQSQKAFLEEAIKMEEAANSMLQTEAKTHLETERELEEKLQAGAMEIMTLRNEKEVQEVESKKLLTELNRLQQGNVTLKEQCQRQQETMQIKNNIIQEMEMDILALHNVIFTVAKEETDLKDEGQINLTRKQVFDLKEELLRLKEEEKKLSANEEKYAVHIFKLEEQLFHSSEHTNVLSDRLTKSIEECTSLEGKVAKLEEDLSVMKQENTNLEGEISSCVAHVKTIEVVMFSLMHDMFCCEETGPAICSGDFLHNQKEERTLLQNNEMLKSENLNLEMHDVRENKWEERICQLQAIRNVMKAELASKLATIRHLEEEKQISQKEKTKVEELLISKEREIEILHGEISSLLEKQNVVKSFHVAAQEAQEDTLAETDQLQREIKNNEREINDFRKPMCNMQGHNSCLEAEESFCEVEKLKKGIFSNKSTQNEGELLPLQSCGDLSCTRLNNKIKEIQETEMEKQQEILPCTQKGINASSVIHNMRDKQARGVTDCHYFVEAAASSGIGKDASTDSITSHVNLGNRLHQEIMNENMQLEVHQLQLEQKKLRLRLQLWMEHKDDLLAEIEKLLDLMVSSTDKHDEEIFKEHQEFSKYSRIDSSLRDLEERILLLQERKDATSVELKFDTKERKRIRNELLVLGEQERTSLSFESWKVKACKLHDEIKRLQKRNEKQFNVFQEIEEQIGKIRIETKRVCSQMVQEHFSPSLQYYKHFSFFTNHSGKAFTWLDTTRSIKMPEGHDPGKASSAAKKLCRCCICISPDAMAEY